MKLRKHPYFNILKISPPKNWKFSDKNSDLHTKVEIIEASSFLCQRTGSGQ